VVRFRGRNETAVSVVNQKHTVNCGLVPLGPKNRILFCVGSDRIKQEERQINSPPSGCDLVSVTKPFATFL
jgi:hypothetical protein